MCCGGQEGDADTQLCHARAARTHIFHMKFVQRWNVVRIPRESPSSVGIRHAVSRVLIVLHMTTLNDISSHSCSSPATAPPWPDEPLE